MSVVVDMEMNNITVIVQYGGGGGGVSLGETATTAHRGDHGKAAYDFSQAQVAVNEALSQQIETLAQVVSALTNALAGKADLVDGAVPSGQLPEVNIFQNIFDSFEDGEVQLGDTGKIDIIGGGGTPNHTITFNISGISDPYILEVNGEVWEDNQKSFPEGTVTDTLVPTIEGYTLSPASISPVTVDADKEFDFVATAEGASDDNLISGFSFLDLSVLTGVGQPPLENTSNTWKITGNGFGQGQPGKHFPVGGEIACRYGASSANTKMCISYQAASLGNYKAIEVEFNGDGVMNITGGKVTGETFPTQPVQGQFVKIKRVSGETSPATFEVSIIGSDKSTVIFAKNYTVTDTPVSSSAVEYDTAGGSAIIYYPQGKGLTDI